MRARALLAVVVVAACAFAAPAGASALVADVGGTSRPLAGRTIVIDPGHQLGNRNYPRKISRKVPAGGFRKPCNSTGTATRGGFAEATFVWRVAMLLRPRLERLGAKVVLTRTSNRQDRWGPCVDERGRKGNKAPADLKLSLHGDGATARHARGFHVIAPTDRKHWTHDIYRTSKRLARQTKSSLRAAGVPVANYTAGGDGLDLPLRPRHAQPLRRPRGHGRARQHAQPPRRPPDDHRSWPLYVRPRPRPSRSSVPPVTRAAPSGQLAGAAPALDRAWGRASANCPLHATPTWGWKLKLPPERPTVTVPRNRNLTGEQRDGVDVRWANLHPDDVRDGVTAPWRTVIDCARTEPFDAALAVADSAVRAGSVSARLLEVEALASPRTGRSAALRVARAADGRAANPFESVLRAICATVPALEVEPQQWVGSVGRVDLLSRRSNLVIEADSWEFHGERSAFARDVRRYTCFVRLGFVVVRFTWEEVMFQQDYVRDVLTAIVQRGPAWVPRAS